MKTCALTLRDVWSGLLDLVYPPFCLVCGAAGEAYLCAKCIEKISLIEGPCCSRCGYPMESLPCRECSDKTLAFSGACSVGVFEGVLREAIHRLKYAGNLVLADPLAELMARHYPTCSIAGKADLVTAVPIHRSRALERGFNQSEELARRMCARTRLPFATGILIKPKETRHQVELPYDMRALNLRGAFKVRDRAAVAGKKILVVDDVFTTGSTLHEAATALKNAGASAVYAYTLAINL